MQATHWITQLIASQSIADLYPVHFLRCGCILSVGKPWMYYVPLLPNHSTPVCSLTGVLWLWTDLLYLRWTDSWQCNQLTNAAYDGFLLPTACNRQQHFEWTWLGENWPTCAVCARDWRYHTTAFVNFYLNEYNAVLHCLVTKLLLTCLHADSRV